MNLSTFCCSLLLNFMGSRILSDAVASQRLLFVAASVTVIFTFARLEIPLYYARFNRSPQ